MVKKLENPPKLDSSDQAKIYSIAHREMVDKAVTKEEAWMRACFVFLVSEGFAVVDATELQNFLDNPKNRP